MEGILLICFDTISMTILNMCNGIVFYKSCSGALCIGSRRLNYYTKKVKKWGSREL